MNNADARTELLKGVPLNRLHDLAARSRDGNLTPLESLALTILNGGSSGETAAAPFIDAAIEHYNHGSYRIPVRVVADWKRCLFLLTTPSNFTHADQRQSHEIMLASVRRLVNGGVEVLTYPAGTKLEVFEQQAPPDPQVVMKPDAG